MTKRSFLQFATKYYEQLLLSFQLLNYWPSVTKYPNEFEHCFHNELLILISLLITLLLQNLLLVRSIYKRLKVSKWLSSKLRGRSMKWIRRSRRRSRRLLRRRLRHDRLSWLVRRRLIIHVIV